MENTYFETKHLRLRPVQSGDEKYIFPEVDDALTEHWIDWESEKNIEGTRKAILEMLELEKNSFSKEFVAFGDRDNFVGCCKLNPSEGEGEYEVGIWVRHAEQGKGYGKEMCRFVIDWAKKNTNLEYIVYSVTEGNVASQHIIEKMNLPVYREFSALKRGVSRRVRDYKVPLR